MFSEHDEVQRTVHKVDKDLISACLDREQLREILGKVPTHESVNYYYGRILPGKMFQVDEETVYSLDLSRMNSYFFYEGQVCRIAGIVEQALDLSNPVLIPSEIVTDATSPNRFKAVEKKDISTLVFSGPFWTEGTSQLESPVFEKMAGTIIDATPTSVILTGPFLTKFQTKEELKEGLEYTYEKYFVKVWDAFLARISTGIDPMIQPRIIFVSSQNDVMARSYMFPTPPLLNIEFPSYNNKKICFVSNPGKFKLGGHSFVVSCVDVLKHVKDRLKDSLTHKDLGFSTPTSKSKVPDHRENIFRSIFHQRCVYPLYPAEKGVTFNFGMYQRLYFAPETTDFLIIPSGSQFQQFFTDKTFDPKNANYKIYGVSPGRVLGTMFTSGVYCKIRTKGDHVKVTHEVLN